MSLKYCTNKASTSESATESITTRQILSVSMAHDAVPQMCWTPTLSLGLIVSICCIGSSHDGPALPSKWLAGDQLPRLTNIDA
jgi:hypothetical protein